jgi:hypothetical protein
MEKKRLEELSENGKYEVKELSYDLNGKKYSCIVRYDFDMIRKASMALVDTSVTQAGGKHNVKVSIDIMGAGDKILFLGWVEGDKEVRTNMRLRIKADKELGQIVQELTADDDEEVEKKS